MKKALSLLLVLAMVLSFAVYGVQASAEADTELTGTLTYWTYTDNAYQLTTEFAKKYPNVTVDVQVFGGDEYKTKILTALQDGTNVPDMFDLEEGYVYEFLDSSLIADLSYVDIEKLTENYNALIGAIIKAKPAASKGQYIKSCVTASTMGPGIKIVTKI